MWRCTIVHVNVIYMMFWYIFVYTCTEKKRAWTWTVIAYCVKRMEHSLLSIFGEWEKKIGWEIRSSQFHISCRDSWHGFSVLFAMETRDTLINWTLVERGSTKFCKLKFQTKQKKSYLWSLWLSFKYVNAKKRQEWQTYFW